MRRPAASASRAGRCAARRRRSAARARPACSANLRPGPTRSRSSMPSTMNRASRPARSASPSKATDSPAIPRPGSGRRRSPPQPSNTAAATGASGYAAVLIAAELRIRLARAIQPIERPTMSKGDLARRLQAGAEHPWSAGFRTLSDEFDYRVDEIDGGVPRALRGTLFRNGVRPQRPRRPVVSPLVRRRRHDLGDPLRRRRHPLSQSLRPDPKLRRRDARRPHRPSRLRQDAARRRDRQRLPPARQCLQHLGRRARTSGCCRCGKAARPTRSIRARWKPWASEDFGGAGQRLLGPPEDRSAQRRAVQLRHRLRRKTTLDALSPAEGALTRFPPIDAALPGDEPRLRADRDATWCSASARSWCIR